MYANFNKILLKHDAHILNILVVLHECNILKIKMLFHPNFPTLLRSKSVVHPIVASIILPTNFIFWILKKSNFLNSISYVTKRWKTENSASFVFLFQPFSNRTSVFVQLFIKILLFSYPSTTHIRKFSFVTYFIFHLILEIFIFIHLFL